MIKPFIRFARLLRIIIVMIRYRLDTLLADTGRFYILQCLIRLNPYYWLHKPKQTKGERLRQALEALGPIFVKFGQMLSTRFDWLPKDIIDELSKLQDRVPPFSQETAIAMIEQSLGAPVDTVFSTFDKEVLASASIAQVHAARLNSGEEVIIKVLRPNIKQLIDSDIDLLALCARWLGTFSTHIQHFKPVEIVNEIAQTLYEELDLLREGANATQLRRNFIKTSELYIPKIYWEYSSPRILVMERIYGIPIYNIHELKAAGFNMKVLAERWIGIFLTQIFRDNFFHADLHPGNIFVSTHHTTLPQFIAVDFGIVGSLSKEDQRYIAENMVAFFKRDYHRVAELHVRCGWLPENTRLDQFSGAIRSVCEPIFEQPLQEISFGQLLLQLFQVARRFHMNIQPQLVLLQKTLLSVEALSRQLFPGLNVWEVATPEIEKWLKKQVGIKAFLSNIRNNLPLWSEQAPELPSLVYEFLSHTPKKISEANHLLAIVEQVVNDRLRKSMLKYYYFFIGAGISTLIGLILFSHV